MDELKDMGSVHNLDAGIFGGGMLIASVTEFEVESFNAGPPFGVLEAARRNLKLILCFEEGVGALGGSSGSVVVDPFLAFLDDARLFPRHE